MTSRRHVLYLCFIAAGVLTISVHLYYTSGFEVVKVITGLSLAFSQSSGSDVIDLKLYKPLPQALNYIPSTVKVKTVRRFDLDTPLNTTPPPDADGYKLIVIHTRAYGGDFLHADAEWFENGAFFYSNATLECPRKCKYSLNRTMAEEAHALIFSVLDDMYHTEPGESRYPIRRRPDQMWIANTIEAPLYHNANALGDLGRYFNWTWTYRLDSDIYVPYGYLYKLDIPRSLADINLPAREDLKSKKLAVTLISNCGALSQRDTVVEAMERHIPIDHFGKCGKECPPDKADCRQYLAENYKFLLSFENSLCQDYITEKFFAALAVGIVPVTYGLGDYAEVAPPGSYINALDFPNVTALTNYLKYLDQNDDKYLEYFHWKQFYGQGPRSLANDFCAVCVKLWDAPNNVTQQITNFNTWWNHKRPMPILEKSLQNLTLGARLLRDAKKNYITPSDIFDRGFLGSM